MKILITGSGGRLGAALARIYGQQHQIVGFNHASLDFSLPGAIAQKLAPLDFDVAINCAALTNVDYCESHEEEAMRINAEAVRELAEACAAKKARCIHISTDYVFDGDKSGPYTETDPAKPLSIYGESKLAGEIELLKVREQNLAVRVSWVFGPDRPSFIDAILKRAMETDQVEAIGDKWSAPSYTIDLAEMLQPLLAGESAGGILHLCNSGSCTWREYGEWALQCAAAAGWPVKTQKVGFLKMSSMTNFVAQRPVNTVLSTERYTSLTGMAPRSWQKAVESHIAAQSGNTR